MYMKYRTKHHLKISTENLNPSFVSFLLLGKENDVIEKKKKDLSDPSLSYDLLNFVWFLAATSKSRSDDVTPAACLLACHLIF